MLSLGVELIEHGDDFQSAREFAIKMAHENSVKMIPSFDPHLVTGVATYSLELLKAVNDLDIVYVPICPPMNQKAEVHQHHDSIAHLNRQS